MQIREPDIIRLIERIGDHYRTNIANRFIRPALLYLPLDNQSWDLIETFTEKIEQYRYQGFHLDELYRQIIACARFVALARKELSGSIRNRIGTVKTSDADRVFREMAMNAFPSNLRIFSDMVNELYVKLVSLDKEYAQAKGIAPLYLQIPELAEVGRQLVGE
ncbi:hypothetical protein [Treponema sp. J25]|uniref:hypothetical protein n=1 Tax=Treponema sp. J25 TaxID=2094121 RepID=UPI00104E960E|nr:hypothetical protein [Treponema sp. J25]TCW60476.1 hypothetical protein C5O22_11380 [Treponema sp. J25]